MFGEINQHETDNSKWRLRKSKLIHQNWCFDSFKIFKIFGFKAIIANMFALLEWCMNMPLEQLKDHDRATLLRNNFKVSL